MNALFWTVLILLMKFIILTPTSTSWPLSKGAWIANVQLSMRVFFLLSLWCCDLSEPAAAGKGHLQVVVWLACVLEVCINFLPLCVA